MDVHSQKQAFLLQEMSLLSLTAALSTRDKAFPIYASKISDNQKQKFKECLRAYLDTLLDTYNQKKISEEEHIALINDFITTINIQFGELLHEQTFRFGIAQKLLNLHLKYLWSAGFLMRAPPHCPIDNALRDKTGLNYNWVSNNSQTDYLAAIGHLKLLAKPHSLAMWELKTIKRNKTD